MTLGRAQEPAKDSGQTPPPASLSEIAGVNNLQGTGKLPYHVVASFQVFTLQGKPAESGTVESWWAQGHGSRLEIHSPSLGSVTSTSPAGQKPAQQRELYLIAQALGEFAQAGSDFSRVKASATAQDQIIGKTALRCYAATSTGAAIYQPATQVCLDADSGAIRLIRDLNSTVVRNRMGKFGSVYVALDEQILWNGLSAIIFHVNSLKSFHLGDPGVPSQLQEEPAENTANAPGSTKLRGGVTAGAKIAGPQPEYPLMARSQHISGSVVLAGTITAHGDVEGLFPIASPSELLTGAAIQAAEQWKYKPYLLNGNPVTVSTTLTMNFHLGPG